jgi:O-antigen ligase
VKISLIDILVGAYLLLGAVNAMAITHGQFDLLLLWRWVAVGAVYAMLRVVAAKRLTSKIVMWGVVIAGFVQSVIAILQQAELVSSNHRMLSVTGSFGNPGPLGGFLAVALVVAITLFFTSAAAKSLTVAGIALVTLLTIAAGLVLADSRAAFVAVITGIAVYFFKSSGQWLLRRRTIALPMTVIVMVFTVMALYGYRPASVDARLLVWQVSMDMVADEPLFGHGIGAFSREYMLYQAHYFETYPDSSFVMVADNVAYPYNELLHVLTEQGIVGGLIFVALFVTIFAHNPRDETQCRIRAGLAALLTFSMFSYPAHIFMLLLLFAVFAGLAESTTMFSFRMRRWATLSIQVILATTCIMTVAKYIYHESAMKYTSLSCEMYCDKGNACADVGDYTAAEHYYKTAALMIPTRLTPNYLLWKMVLSRGDTLRAMEIGNAMLSQPLKVENTYTLRAKAEVNKFLNE